MRFTAILGTIDEVDILPRSIEHLRRIGVDRIIVLDHGSTDGSLDYIAQAETAGDLWLIHIPESDDEDVHRRRSGIRAELARASETDWVFFLDSDEFWLPAGGSLRTLADLESADVLYAMRYNVILGPEGPAMPPTFIPDAYDETLLFAQPVRDFHAYVQRHPDAPWISGVLEPKVMVRPEAISSLHAGAHDIGVVEGRHWRRVVAADVLIAHVPFRSLELFERRAQNARAEVARRPRWFTGARGWQFSRWAEAAETGTTREEFERQRLDAQALAELRSTGVVRSVADIFRRLIPEISTDAAYGDIVLRAEPWLSVAGMVCRRESIDPNGEVYHYSTGDFPTVLVRPGHVVRFFSRWRSGQEVMDREVSALRLLEQDPDLPAPRYVTHGVLDDNWHYLVISLVQGTPLGDTSSVLSPRAMDEVAVWLGQTVSRLHAIALPPDKRVASWDRFREMVAKRHTAVTTEMSERSWLSPVLVGEIDAWLPPVDELLGSVAGTVLTHGNLHDGHVLGHYIRDQERFEPTAVTSFSRAGVGHPLWDLGPIWWSVLRGDQSLTAHFLATAHFPGWKDADFPRLALAWSLLNPGPAGAKAPGMDEVASLGELAALSFGTNQPMGRA